jgi:hypothetical protein
MRMLTDHITDGLADTDLLLANDDARQNVFLDLVPRNIPT